MKALHRLRLKNLQENIKVRFKGNASACAQAIERSHTFLWNARVNLDRGAAALTNLRGLRVPAELEPVPVWLQRSLAFSLWLEETKLEFFRTADVGVLRRDLKTSTSVDATRELLRLTQQSPFEARGQVLVIAEAESLTPEAANALLKQLEEPPTSAPRDSGWTPLAWCWRPASWTFTPTTTRSSRGIRSPRHPPRSA